MKRIVRCSFLPWLLLGVVPAGLLVLLALLVRGGWPGASPARTGPALATYEELTNSRFTPPPADPHALPRLAPVSLPHFPGASAIWGATGRDARGHVWFGVSASAGPNASAHLFEFNPGAGELVDRGDVLARLKECRAYRPGEGQMKIHSKIIQGEDGFLYFASVDEQGENEDGSRLPTWGSHLWRLRPTEERWEHLLAVPEGLIAVAGVGRYIYALGYFDHVLYQYDCSTGKSRSLRVGSVGGHISRNLLCDHRGHAYVPRLRPGSGTPPRPVVTLVELDPELRQVGETRLGHYLDTTPEESHGIVAFQYLADHSIAFITHPGYLYRLIPSDYGPTLVAPLGWFHPKGKAYAASLFTYAGKRYLLGAARRIFTGEKGYEWVVYDLHTHSSRATPLPVPVAGEDLLLYGSLTRDDRGSFYLAGTDGGPRGRPVLLQTQPPQP